MKFFGSQRLFSIAASLTFFSGCAWAQTVQWTDCASEGSVCAFQGAKLVRYGNNATWTDGIYIDGVRCNNATLGNPLPGASKRCQIAEPLWNDCAREKERCDFDGEKAVRYGQNGVWATEFHTNGVSCNNRTFGDPLRGTFKKCQTASRPEVLPPPCNGDCGQSVEAVNAEQGKLLVVNLAEYRPMNSDTAFAPVSQSMPSWLSFDAERSRFVGVYSADTVAPAKFEVDVIDAGDVVERIRFEVNVAGKSDLVPSDRKAQNQAFLDDLFSREANFLRAGVGYDAVTAMTYDGHGIDRNTLELQGPARFWSTSSKESLHVALLVKALMGDTLAQTLINANSGQDPIARALDVLRRKMSAYEQFNQSYPSYGGYLPWVVSQNRGAGVRIYPADDWIHRAPALDNGQLAWSLYLAYKVLEDRGETALAQRYRNHFNLMVSNGKRLFLNGRGDNFVGETRFGTMGNANPSIPPSQQTYFKDSYLMNDSLEGELFVLLMMLFSPDLTAAEKQAVWSNKRLDTLVYQNANGQAISGFDGWVFSSHEQWKFLVLPYTDNPLMRDLFINAQKIRADYSLRNGYPGFFAAIHDKDLNYLNKLGIPGLGTDQSDISDVIAPYATFPVILSDALLGQDTGLRWFRSLVSADKMVGPYGVSESLDSSDGAISPLLTWDNKGTTNLALTGGIYNEIRENLIEDGLYGTFLNYLERDLEKINPTIYGTGLPVQGPDDLGCQGGGTPLNIDFDCNAPALANTTAVQNPAVSAVNSSSVVGQYRDPLDQWSAVVVNLPSAIDLQNYGKVGIKVLAPVAGVLKAKLENGTAAPVEIDADVTQLNRWQEYNFDFSAYAGGNYTRLVIFFNAGVTPANDDIYYFDDLRLSR